MSESADKPCDSLALLGDYDSDEKEASPEEKPSSSEPVVQEKPINPENFDDLLVMSGENSSSPKQLYDSSVDKPKSRESSKSPEQGEKPLEQPNKDLSNVMVQLTLTTDNSDKVSPSLSDMPVDVIALIIERSDYKQQLILRKVSKSLRALVDKLKPACESVRYKVWDDNVTIHFDEQYVMYSEDGLIFDDDMIGVERDDFETAALEDLAATLNNPRLQLKEFVVDYEPDATHYNKKYNEVRKILEPLNHQVSAERFELTCVNCSSLLSILPYLKPCVLKTISFHYDDREEVDWSVNLTEMDQIARLEQWKKAEELEFEYVCFDKFPMEHATHFKRFRFVDVDMDGEKFIRIIEYLSKLEHFEHCTLWSSAFHTQNLLHQVLGTPVFSNTTEEIFHHPIANTDYYIEFKQEKDFKSEFYNPGFVEIEKKKQRINYNCYH